MVYTLRCEFITCTRSIVQDKTVLFHFTIIVILVVWGKKKKNVVYITGITGGFMEDRYGRDRYGTDRLKIWIMGN